MILKFRKDENGKLLPPTDEEIDVALAINNGIPKKNNGPALDQCVLLTALQGKRGAVRGKEEIADE